MPLTMDRTMDIRLVIIILTEYVGYHSTIRFYDTIVSTSYIALAIYRLDHDQSKNIKLATVYHIS